MTLADLADVNPPTDVSRLGPADLVSFIPMADLSDDGRWLGCDTRPLSTVKMGYTSFQDGDVLLAKITPCMENGKGWLATGLVNGIGFGSTEFHVLRAKPDADAEYLFQWTKFKVLRQKAANAMTGSAGQQRVPADFLRRFPITEHSPDEQEMIGLVLATVDRAIEQTEALLAKQERIKAGLMHDLLTRGLDAQGRLRDPDTHRFKPSPLGPIPEEWEVRALANVVPRNRPIVYGILMPGDYVEGGVPVIKVKDIQGGFIQREELLRTDPKIDAAFARSRLKSGDLLFTIRGSVGRMAVVPADLEGANITQDTARITVSEGNTTFIRHCLEMPPQRSFIDLHTIGQAVKGINLGEVRKIPIQFPQPDEQNEIARRLDAKDRDMKATADQLAKLRRLKTGLMQDLLTGRVPVTPLLAEPEPANAAA